VDVVGILKVSFPNAQNYTGGKPEANTYTAL